MKTYSLLFFVFLTSLSSSVCANNNFFQWHSSNTQLLQGYDYELGDSKRKVLSLEHANGFKYGDFFMFADKEWQANSSSYYSEATIRLSAKKIFQTSFSNKFIKDVLFATQIEKPKHKSITKLAGIAVDLKVNGFNFIKTHLFYKDNPALSGASYQITLAWQYINTINGINIVFEGFTDIASPEGNRVSNQLFVPRLLADISNLVGIKSKKLWIGVEWQYWHNKFGLKGITESVPQVQLKYVI